MPPETPSSVVEIRTTLPSREAAERCARGLVDRGLAACVQIDGPVTSVYRWQGAVETATEFRCICKTTLERADACTAALLAGHPYDLPEVLRVQCGASAAYAAWVSASVANA